MLIYLLLGISLSEAANIETQELKNILLNCPLI